MLRRQRYLSLYYRGKLWIFISALLFIVCFLRWLYPPPITLAVLCKLRYLSLYYRGKWWIFISVLCINYSDPFLAGLSPPPLTSAVLNIRRYLSLYYRGKWWTFICDSFLAGLFSTPLAVVVLCRQRYLSLYYRGKWWIFISVLRINYSDPFSIRTVFCSLNSSNIAQTPRDVVNFHICISYQLLWFFSSRAVSSSLDITNIEHAEILTTILPRTAKENDEFSSLYSLSITVILFQ